MRDQHRSRLPILVVAIGVMLTVFFYCYLNGVMGDGINMSAKFQTGHVKVMSKAYAELADQMPNDLALMNVEPLLADLRSNYSDMDWVERITFGGLLDVPDENGETRKQGNVLGFAVDLFSENSQELERMNISKSLKDGSLPKKSGEILISKDFAAKLNVKPGDDVTLIGSTMFGSMCFYNFKVTGTISFGNSAMDKGSIMVDITDAKLALDMTDATSEILGFIPGEFYNREITDPIKDAFNAKYLDENDEFAPIMKSLEEQAGMGQMLLMAENMGAIINMVFIFALSIVLWNAGLLGGIRRYGEFGLRIAIGENKSHIYKTMIYESILIGLIGSIIGTAFGLLFSALLQKYGFDVGSMMKDTTMMLPTVFRAKITTEAYYIGFVPGLLATLIGTMLSGLVIFKRKTANLFKELEH